jgi:hypothetical protein
MLILILNISQLFENQLAENNFQPKNSVCAKSTDEPKCQLFELRYFNGLQAL